MMKMGSAVSLGEPWGWCRREWKEGPALPDTVSPFCVRKGVTKNPPKRSVQHTIPLRDYLAWKADARWARTNRECGKGTSPLDVELLRNSIGLSVPI